MQIGGVAAAWGQRDFAPEAENRQAGESAAQQNGEEKRLRGAPTGDAQKEKTDRYEQSDEEMLKYLELLKKERSGADKQRQAQSDELKALRIAHNIMRGKKVPPKDESFLLTKNFKMYMAAKNVASMIECTGTAKSELGNDGASSVSGGASSAEGSASGVGAGSGAADSLAAAMMAAGGMAADGSGEMADELASDLSDLVAVEGFAGAGADAMADGLLSMEGGLFSGEKRTAVEAFSSDARGTTDYSTLIEGMKANDGITRSSGISRTSPGKKKRKRFQYNFKEISARIMSAKTSGNARQVLAQARQRSASLRRELKSGMYDEEAVQLALIHAEAMERVAKKKMMHLEEEEAAKKTGGVCAGDTDEEDRIEQQMQDEQLRYERKADGSQAAATSVLTAPAAEAPAEDVSMKALTDFHIPSAPGGYAEDIPQSMEELMAEAVQTPVLDITDSMSELLDAFEELMEDTLEEVANVDELAEEMLSGGGKTLDPADLEEKKRKHRTEEQRAIAEADSKYLKAFFNKLQREQRAIASGVSRVAAAMNGGGGMLSLASGATPAASASAATASSAPAAGATGTTESAAPAVDVISTAATSASAPAAEFSVSVETAVTAAAAEGGSIDISL